MNPDGDLLLQAEKVAVVLASHGIPALLIGAGAMAVHHHVRMTRDVDLGVAVPLDDARSGRLSRPGRWARQARRHQF